MPTIHATLTNPTQSYVSLSVTPLADWLTDQWLYVGIASDIAEQERRRPWSWLVRRAERAQGVRS